MGSHKPFNENILGHVACSAKKCATSGKLAVFWYNGRSFMGPSASLDGPRVETYGDFLQLPDDHFEIWDQYNNVSPEMEYDFWPRARILFKVTIHKFVVLGDKRIVEDQEVRQRILKDYGLPVATIFESDVHYK